MGRVIHFEIHAAEPDRAVDFYTRVFGWKFQHIPQLDYWLVRTGDGEGIDGGLMRRKGPAPVDGQPVNAFVCTIAVEDVDAAVRAAEEAGGRVAMAKFAIPGVGWAAFIKDTEGNILGVHKADAAAA
jgi:predicted enzyme related to lactoylglutathione lyase